MPTNIDRSIPFNANKTIVPRSNFNQTPPTSDNDPVIQDIQEKTGHDNNVAETFNSQNAFWANEVRRLLNDLTNAVGNMDGIFINGVQFTSLGEAIAQLVFNLTGNQLFSKLQSINSGIGVYKNRWDAVYGSAIQNVEGFLPVGMFEILDIDIINRKMRVESGAALADAIFALIFRNEFDPDEFFSYAKTIDIPNTTTKFNVVNSVDAAGAPIYDWDVPDDRVIPATTTNIGKVIDISAYDLANSTNIVGFLADRYPVLGPFNQMIIVNYNGESDLGIIYRGTEVKDATGSLDVTMIVGVDTNGPGPGPPLVTDPVTGVDYVDLNADGVARWLVEPDGPTPNAILVRYFPAAAEDPDEAGLGRVGVGFSTGSPTYNTSIAILIGTEVDNLPLNTEVYFVYKRREPRNDIVQVGQIDLPGGGIEVGINIKEGSGDTEIPDRDFNNVPLWAYKLNEFNELVNPDNDQAFKDHPFYGSGVDMKDQRRIIDTEHIRKINERQIFLPASPYTLGDEDWVVLARMNEDINVIPQGLSGTSLIRNRFEVILRDDIPNAFINRNDFWRVQFAVVEDDIVTAIGANPPSITMLNDFHDASAVFNVPGNFLFDPSQDTLDTLLFPIYDENAPALPPSFTAFTDTLNNIITIDGNGNGELIGGNIDPVIPLNLQTGIRLREFNNTTEQFTAVADHQTLVLIEQVASDLIEYGRFRQIDFSKPVQIYTSSGPNQEFDINPTTGQITNANGITYPTDLSNKTLYAFYRIGSTLLRPMSFLTRETNDGQYQELSDFFEVLPHNRAMLVARINNEAGTYTPGALGVTTAEILKIVLSSYRIDGISDIAFGQNQYNEHLYGY